jgi:hypothetical protein
LPRSNLYRAKKPEKRPLSAIDFSATIGSLVGLAGGREVLRHEMMARRITTQQAIS